MAAVANATGLVPPEDGLQFPAVGVYGLAEMLKPAADGGLVEHAGTVEVVSCLETDGRPVADDRSEPLARGDRPPTCLG